MPDQRDDIIRFIKENGPVLPVQIAKLLNTNILFSSAMLSELVDRKLLKITHASIGGSPLYFLSGQEALIDDRLSKSLSGKEKEAYNLIKEKKVLRELDLEPWQRVAIKSLVDFTNPLNVTVDDYTEIFWKHHLLSDAEASELIKDIITNLKVEIPVKNKQQKTIQQQVIAEQQTQSKQESIVEESSSYLSIEEQPVWQSNLITENIDKIKGSLVDKPQKKEKQVKEKKKIIKKIPDDFYNDIINYLNNNNIKIIKKETVKQNKEYDFIVDLPSTLGDLRYFLKAKSKTSVNEADISMAFSDAQIKNLPAILLVNGKLNKKALVLAETKFKGQLILKEI